MEKKKTCIIVITIIVLVVGLLGAFLYKPVKSMVFCNQILSIPPSFVYTKGGFRDCMRQANVSNFFTETYIQIRESVDRNKEVLEYLKESY